MNTTTQHPLQVFCDEQARRYALGSPWYVDGKAFASDGKIAAWMPSEPFESTAEGRRPDARFIIGMEPKGLEYTPLPTLPALPPCSLCNGLGYTIQEECEECDGTGEIEHECDCEHCAEDTDECPECGGIGKFTGDDAKIECCCKFPDFELLGMNFGLEMLHKIASLGEVRVAAAPEVDQLWFWCGRISGVLMAKTKA